MNTVHADAADSGYANDRPAQAALEHLFRPGPRRALPRSCRPAQDETTGSYLLRLAATNRLTGNDLIDYLTHGTSRSIDAVSLTALAVASSQPQLALAYALPQLRGQHPLSHTMAVTGRTLPAAPNTVRPACRRCAAAHPASERIDLWCRHEHNTCLRHRLWTGPGAENPRDQVDLAAHPDIVHTQLRHLRLIRRRGRRTVHAAYQIALTIWRALTEQGPGLPYSTARHIPLPNHFGHQDWPFTYTDPVHSAADYPEIVTLTGLLTSPRWQTPVSSLLALDQLHHDLHDELRARLPPACHTPLDRDLHLPATIRAALTEDPIPPPETSP